MARRKLRAPEAEPVEPTVGATDGTAAPGSVGATLRDARERRGWTIADIAQQLRIRAAVLEAMEAGRFETLPNGAYALGFVRSYADFLGLDRDEIARRVKAEAAALNARTELIFPKPLSEGRMPSGVVLLVSIAIAVIGYGLWYYHSSKVQVAIPRVEAVPERLAGKSDRPSRSPSDADAATVTTPAPAPMASEPQSPTVAAKPDTSSEVAPSVRPSPPSPSAPPPASPVQPLATQSAPPAAPAEPQVAAAPPASTPAAPATAPEVKPPATPKQFGETDSRIVIKATADSWVQVRDAGGSVVFSRILRDGESYGVPNRSGQVLATGNAGVLEITVDGKKAPTIGRVGFTQKDVPLDPVRLAAGTAVVEPRPAARPKPPAPANPPAATPPSAAPSETPAAPATPGGNG